MKLTTDYEREREAERKSRERGLHSRGKHKVDPTGETCLALGTNEKCPCVEMTKQLLEHHSLSNTCLQKFREKIHTYMHTPREFSPAKLHASPCRHGLLLSTILAMDRSSLLGQLHAWGFISFKSLDTHGQNILHWAVKRQAGKCIAELIKLFGSEEASKWILDRWGGCRWF